MKTWVFLRGLAREARHWGDFPAVFREAMPDARVITLDLPGNGCLNRETSPATVDALAARARAELARRDAPPPFHLLGLSLGAMVAVAWAHRHPGEVAAGVLINTSLRPYSPFFRRLRPASYATLLRLVLAGGNARRREQDVLRLTSCLADAGVVADWTRYHTENPVSPKNALRQLLAAARYRAPKPMPDLPFLLLAGARDRLVSPRATRAIAAQWRCAMAEHPLAGHDLPLDDPRWVAHRVRDWLTAREESIDAHGIAPNDVSVASSESGIG